VDAAQRATSATLHAIVASVGLVFPSANPRLGKLLEVMGRKWRLIIGRTSNI
jgi:hypothetical protein